MAAFDPLQASSIKKIFDLVLGIVSRRTAARSDIYNNLTEKWQEIEQIHVLFTRSIRSIRQVSGESLRRLRQSDDTDRILGEFAAKIAEIEKERNERRHERLAQFQEARAYIDSEIIGKRGIIKTIPDDVVIDIIMFMEAFCSYFGQMSNGLTRKYEHELQHVLMAVDACIDRAGRRAGANITKEDALQHLDYAVTMSGIALDTLDERWQEVAFRYSRLKLNFQQLDPGLAPGKTSRRK